MLLYDARQSVRQFARNAGDSSMYSDAAIDRALQFVGQRFCRQTKALKSLGFITFTAAQNSFGVLMDGISLMPQNLLAAYLADGTTLQVIDIADLQRMASESTVTGKPCYAAVQSTADAVGAGVGFTVFVWPASNGVSPANSLNYRIWLPFTEWPAGSQGAWSLSTQYQIGDIVSFTGTPYVAITPSLDLSPPGNAAAWKAAGSITVADPTSLTLNLPDPWLIEILPYGPPAVLQHNEPEHLKAGVSSWWDQYLAIEKSFMGAGIMARKVIDRKKRGCARRVEPWAVGH